MPADRPFQVGDFVTCLDNDNLGYLPHGIPQVGVTYQVTFARYQGCVVALNIGPFYFEGTRFELADPSSFVFPPLPPTNHRIGVPKGKLP